MKISVIHTQVRKYTRKIRETAVETQQSFACFLFVCMKERRNIGKELEHLEARTLTASTISGSFTPVVYCID